MHIISRAALAALAVFAVSSARAADYQTNNNVVPFGKFVQGVYGAREQDFTHRSGTAVRDQAAFEEMRHYLINMYGSITVKHSFAIGSSAFDCVRMLDQPSARAMHLTSIATPPPAPPHVEGSKAAATSAVASSRLCEAGTIPMRRITLDELTRFATLQDVFRKAPRGTDVHYYAHGSQSIKSYGGYADFSVWKPAIDTAHNQIFSLSQLWMVGDETTKKAQTAEAGWQVYPAKWSVADPVLFIYWTADSYNKTGCYNLECTGFVQYNSALPLGAAIAHSTDGGKQQEQTLAYYLASGNWWLWWNNSWAGYYPASQYGKGQMSKKDDLVDFGGEVAGTGNWAPMGGGKFPTKGYKHAAYTRSIWSLDINDQGTSANLTNAQLTPSCYTISETQTPGDPSWSSYTYFFFGGPGGKKCN